MKNLTRLGGIIAIGAAIIILAGCATSVPIKSVRQPTIDTGDIQRLAIRPFENKSGVGGSFGAQITTYLTDKAMQMVPSFGYFTIVASSDPNAEGVFTGEIRNLEARDSQEQRQRKDKDGNVINYIVYKRDVSLEFQYSVISSRTGMPVGIVSKQGSTSSYAEQQDRITDPLTLAKSIVDSQLRQLQRDIVPTIVSSSRKLMAETSKDKAVKQLMREAQALVKNGNLEEAIRQYDKISDEHGSVAARTNAGILRESVASDIAARAELTALFNNTSGLPERAAKGAVDALNSRLPSGANIMIAITSSTERNMLDYVVDQMTKTIVQAGSLRVVERSSLALINAEQQYQASGNVSDDSFVSIGRQLGAQYIVLCGISGVMSNRRLTLRVLNVETAQVIDQKDFEI